MGLQMFECLLWCLVNLYKKIFQMLSRGGDFEEPSQIGVLQLTSTIVIQPAFQLWILRDI